VILIDEGSPGKRGLSVGWDFQRQKSRNPLRCQRSSVSAFTFTSIAPPEGEETAQPCNRAESFREKDQPGAYRTTQSEYESISAAKRPGYNKTSKQQSGASISDPEARIMRHSAAPCARRYNVQVSTDIADGIVNPY
jgi:hypothetical protein